MELQVLTQIQKTGIADPFSVLGPHQENGAFHIRVLEPEATAVYAISDDGVLSEAFREVEPGFFELVTDEPFRYRLRIYRNGKETTMEDTYRFGPVISQTDLWLLHEGKHMRPWQCLGSHCCELDGVNGVRFAVWAPDVRRVSVVGDFNGWDGRRHMMRSRTNSGVWEIFIPGLTTGCAYKYEIVAEDGTVLPLKGDPYAFACELRPNTASIVTDLPEPPQPLQQKHPSAATRPVSIYEVHLGSWRRHNDGSFYSWKELTDELIPYVTGLGFTHLELLPVSEHPFDGSWGYQAMGLYAPTSRFGAPQGFADFVSACHEAGLAVIVDWVPAHFPKDAVGLGRFCGQAVYEYADPKEGEHRDWGTYIYNLARNEVQNFLVGNALFWAEVYGVDGLRVDAVASMLYRDYSRPAGEWIPNIHGGRENLEAVAFLKRVNDVLNAQHESVATFAEESTTWSGVSRPTKDGGLGFNYKWNMGWMHDVLDYMKQDPIYRQWHHNKLSFGLMYAYSEHFVLPLSHDEVVHGKYSLIEKMPGDDWQKFANLRAMFGFMWAYPGKKLLFMGGEFAQRREWNDSKGLDWEVLEKTPHQGVQKLIHDLNQILVITPALFEQDCVPAGFEWLTVDDKQNSVFAFMRKAADQRDAVVVICNFTPVVRENYRIGVPVAGTYREILNTDSSYYGGSNRGITAVAAVDSSAVASHGKKHSILLTIPPLATVYLKVYPAPEPVVVAKDKHSKKKKAGKKLHKVGKKSLCKSGKKNNKKAQ